MVFYETMIKKVVSKINEDNDIKELSIYDIMFFTDTTQYVVARTVARGLEQKGLLRKQGNKWIITSG